MATLLKELPSFSVLLSAYASISAMVMLIRTILNEMVPERMRDYIASKFSELTSTYFSSEFTFFIEDRWQASDNQLFRAAEVYLPTRIGPSSDSLLVGFNDSNEPTAPPKRSIPVNCTIMDDFEGIRLEWTFSSIETKKCYVPNKRYFAVTCKKSARERVEQRYFTYISKEAQVILNKRESLSIYTYDQDCSMWESAVFKHPAKFETLAIEPKLKQFIMGDLDSFGKRKEFFENVGRAWKRGYLLYGPPGTGKSSLVAAIANYLSYDIYDLQFQIVRNDADLRRILTSTTNRSILLIEDIDCSTNVSRGRAQVKEKPEDEEDDEPKSPSAIDPGVTLSGLLNFIDGLWSSCGNERIIIFTTNHKEMLDPALLRPGRMDVHIYMGYCTPAAFRKLSTTYLGIKEAGIKEAKLFGCIDELIESIEVTPAEVAQQLMISDDPKTALEGLIDFLNVKKKKTEEGVVEKEEKTEEGDMIIKDKSPAAPTAEQRQQQKMKRMPQHHEKKGILEKIKTKLPGIN